MTDLFGAIFTRTYGLFVPLLTFFCILVAGYILRLVSVRHLTAWAKRTKTRADDIIIDSIKGPFILWAVILGFYFAGNSIELPRQNVLLMEKILVALTIASVTLVIADIFSKLISAYSNKANAFVPITTLTQNIARIVLCVIGALIILNYFGISITPILATLGIGGLAGALALQDTFSNLFAGFHIMAAKNIKIGDYIELESGESGYVADINWHNTMIRMLPNNIVMVPNDKLIRTVIKNYYLPEKELAVLVDVGVHYGSDLEKTEKITCEVGKQTMKDVAGGVPDFTPFIRYNAFRDFSINFTVILRAKEYVDQYLIKHEFIKKLHKRFAQEGIVIPYPIRAINYEQEKKESE
ncbi:MAG: mechanosensitive ion channel family protein [bacterium]